MLNQNKEFCYRICHIKNLVHILANGLCTKNHEKASSDFVTIGNPEIINSRDITPVKIGGYGFIGDYIPFYFTPRSIMLYNIITGYKAPLVPKLHKEDVLVIRCLINDIADGNKFFFTDGQANTQITNHFNDLKHLNEIDWQSIQNGNFSKSDGDFDRPRRYQAEFLIEKHVPVSKIESLHVFNNNAQNYVNSVLDKFGIINLRVQITPLYFFN